MRAKITPLFKRLELVFIFVKANFIFMSILKLIKHVNGLSTTIYTIPRYNFPWPQVLEQPCGL